MFCEEADAGLAKSKRSLDPVAPCDGNLEKPERGWLEGKEHEGGIEVQETSLIAQRTHCEEYIKSNPEGYS